MSVSFVFGDSVHPLTIPEEKFDSGSGNASQVSDPDGAYWSVLSPGMGKSFPAAGAGWVVGFECQNAGGDLFGTSHAGSLGILLKWQTSGGVTGLAVVLSGGPTVEQSDFLPGGTEWHYVEFGWMIAGASGLYEVRADNGVIMAGSYDLGATVPDALVWKTGRYRNLYVLNGASWSRGEGFWGPTLARHYVGNADGDASGYTPDSGSIHYDRVDDAAPDGDATRLDTSTPGATELFGIQDHSATNAIRAVQTCVMGRSNGAGTHTVSPRFSLNGQEASGGSAKSLASSYDQFRLWQHETNPVTGGGWTLPQWNAIQGGFRADAVPVEERITAVVWEVFGPKPATAVYRTGLPSNLSSECLTLALCVRIERLDGTVLGLTTHDHDLEVDGETYETMNSIQATALTQEIGAQVGNLDVTGVIASEKIYDADLRGGVYDNAEVRLFLVDWSDLGAGAMKLLRGVIGQVDVSDGKYVAELRSQGGQRLAQQIGEMTSPTCTVKELGDSRCKLDLTAFRNSRTVLSAASPIELTFGGDANVNGYYSAGKCSFTSGLNSGMSREIKTHATDGANAIVQLSEAFPFEVAIGDVATLEAGCDRTLQVCKDRFSNTINFRGWPHVPGNTVLMVRGRGGQS